MLPYYGSNSHSGGLGVLINIRRVRTTCVGNNVAVRVSAVYLCNVVPHRVYSLWSRVSPHACVLGMPTVPGSVGRGHFSFLSSPLGLSALLLRESRLPICHIQDSMACDSHISYNDSACCIGSHIPFSIPSTRALSGPDIPSYARLLRTQMLMDVPRGLPDVCHVYPTAKDPTEYAHTRVST